MMSSAKIQVYSVSEIHNACGMCSTCRFFADLDLSSMKGQQYCIDLGVAELVGLRLVDIPKMPLKICLSKVAPGT